MIYRSGHFATRVALCSAQRRNLCSGVLRVRKLAPALAAEIKDVKLTDAISDVKLLSSIKAAFNQYQVLLFRNHTDFDPKDQVAFTKKFGNVEPHPMNTRWFE